MNHTSGRRLSLVPRPWGFSGSRRGWFTRSETEKGRNKCRVFAIVMKEFSQLMSALLNISFYRFKACRWYVPQKHLGSCSSRKKCLAGYWTVTVSILYPIRSIGECHKWGRFGNSNSNQSRGRLKASPSESFSAPSSVQKYASVLTWQMLVASTLTSLEAAIAASLADHHT